MKFFKLLSKKQKKTLFVIFLFMMIASFLDIVSIGIVVPLIQSISNFDQNNLLGYRYISVLKEYFSSTSIQISIAIFVIIIFFIRNFFLVFLSWFKTRFIVYLSASWREKLFYLYLSQNLKFHLKKNSAALLRNINQEISQAINSYAAPLLDFYLNVLILLVITSFLFYIYPITTLYVVIIFGIIAVSINFFLKKKLFNIGIIRQQTNLKMLQFLREGFDNVANIKIFNAKDFFINLFRPHNYRLSRTGVKRSIYGALPKLMFELIFISLVSFFIIFTILSENSAQDLFNKLVFFSVASLRIIPALNSLSVSYQKIRYGKPAISLIHEEFKMLENFTEQSNEDKFNFDGDIKIRDISFKHENSEEYLLKNINFEIKKNKVTGIIGHNGSGKTTLINVICGLLKPNQGQIKVNEKNINENLSSWQKIIGFIPQNIFMIDGTIESNIAFGVDKSNIESDKIEKVMSLTELDKDFKKNYFIGEQGRLLSGGQKQKIAICRALYHEPELLIFDEPTSALDSEAEKRFIDNFIKSSNKTVILVSHKKEPLKYCDLIFELKDGKFIKHLNNESR